MVTTTTKRQARPRTQSDPIRPGETLKLRDFKARTQIKDAAWAKAKRESAKLGINLAFFVGRQVYVSTDAWIQFLTSLPDRTPKP